MTIRSNRLTSLLFLKSIILSNFRRLDFPLKISLVATYRCNLKCRMCNIWKRPSSEKELTASQIDDFFRKADRFLWVGFTGGEVFLRPDMREITDIVLSRCSYLYAVHFATNGQMTEEILSLTSHMKRKKKSVKVLYTVSIDGPPQLHDWIRGREGAWEKAVHTFRELKKIPGVKAQIGFTLSHYNLDKFPDMFSALKEKHPSIRFDDITVNVFQRSPVYYDNWDLEDIDAGKAAASIREILDMDREGFSLNNFLRRKYLALYLKYIKMKKPPLKCQALSASCFLDPYGNLFPCTMYKKKLINVKDMKECFGRLWNTDEAKSLSRECSGNKCPSCWSPCDAYSTIGGSLLRSCLARP